MNARCKLRCDVVELHAGYQEVIFHAEYDKNVPEDVNFNTATPNAKFAVTINNPALLGAFEPGKHYYVEISPAPVLPEGTKPAPGSFADKEGLVADGKGYWRKPTQEEIDNRTPALT